jgi:hypothetical protein
MHLQQYVSVHTYWLQILNVTYSNMSVFTLTGYRYQTSLTTICQCSHLLVTDIKRHLQQYVSVYVQFYWLGEPEYGRNTTNLPQVTIHPYYLKLYRVHRHWQELSQDLYCISSVDVNPATMIRFRPWYPNIVNCKSILICFNNKIKNKTYHTVVTVSKSNLKS